MIAKDEAKTGALRMIRAEFLKAEKEKGTPVDDTRAMAILQTMLKQRQESIDQFEKAGRNDLADKEKSEAAVFKAYLPESLSDAEMDAIIGAVLAEAGPVDSRQMGKLMGAVMSRLKATGRPFDGKAANERVKAKLG
jgi:uncharacterized protein YqeY